MREAETSPPVPDRYWWVKMLVASAALAALLLGFAFLFPVARLHYHAWQYRKNGNGQSLEIVARWLADKHADRATITRLLGSPERSLSPPTANLSEVMIYLGHSSTHADPDVICISMHGDRAAGFENGGP